MKNNTIVKKKKLTSKYEAKNDAIFYAKKEGLLLDILLDFFSDKSRNNVKTILASRQVSVEDEATTQFDQIVKLGEKITVCWSKQREEKKVTGVGILFEDDEIIVINKVNGLLSMGSEKEREQTAYNMLKNYVKNNSSQNKIFIVHRLDKDTSGVMMFARTEAMQQTLQTQWKDIVTKRTYVAVVEGNLEEKQGEIVSWLKENSAFVTYSSPTNNGGKKAITRYKVLKENKYFSLVEAEIETGRKNQIRIHMQTLGHSIVGDKKYGATHSPINRLGLHAKLLEFVHPTTGKKMRFETDVPTKFLSLFGKNSKKYFTK